MIGTISRGVENMKLPMERMVEQLHLFRLKLLWEQFKDHEEITKEHQHELE